MRRLHIGNDRPLPAVAATGSLSRTTLRCLRKTVIAGALVLAILPAYPQTSTQPQPVFEVASIRPSDPGTTMKSMQVLLDDSRVTIRKLSLKELMQYAWGNVGGGEGLHASLISGGPGWVDHDRFDVVAKPEGVRVPSRAERRQMLRKLLVERFQLKFHQETRATGVYALVVEKNGPKMKARTPDDGGLPFSPSVHQRFAHHWPQCPDGSVGGRSARDSSAYGWTIALRVDNCAAVATRAVLATYEDAPVRVRKSLITPSSRAV
jgi:uncharacterized protein (TIGR03435 family)